MGSGPTRHARVLFLYHEGSGMRVTCDIAETTLTNDDGYDVESVEAICRECGHITESFGTDDPSVKRCLALMREECPRGQWNFYVEGSGGDDIEEWF
jgi:hypothetical protein